MQASRPGSNRSARAGRLRRCGLLAAAVIALLAATGCEMENNRRWPWSTPEDSAAVRAELARWRPVLNPSPALSETLALGLHVGLSFVDSTSATGETLYKLCHVTRAWYEPTEPVHADEFEFGVTADSVALTDTFCQVKGYRDSIPGCRLHFEFDSLWVVGFRPDTTVDTSRTPPETTITQKVSYTDKRQYSELQRGVKSFPWLTKRSLFLRKVDSLYRLRRMSGFRATMPSAEEAPSVASVAVLRPGRSDTFRYSPSPGGRSVNNLVDVDSLFEVRAGEEFTVALNSSTPEDTGANKNRFYVILAGRRTDITTAAKRGEGAVEFGAADTGYQHIYVEIVPWSNLLYPDAAYTATIWAIPVRVTP